jgi:tetratricopeptide (TPR) repeat protein
MLATRLDHRLGNITRAKGWAKRWTQAEPARLEAWYTLGVCAGDCGDVDEEIAAYEQCLALDKNDGFTLINLGGRYSEQGRFVEAEELLQRARFVQRNDPLAYRNLAVCLAMQHKNDQAVQVFLDMVELGKSSGSSNRRAIYEMIQEMSSLLDESVRHELSPYMLQLHELTAKRSSRFPFLA